VKLVGRHFCGLDCSRKGSLIFYRAPNKLHVYELANMSESTQAPVAVLATSQQSIVIATAPPGVELPKKQRRNSSFRPEGGLHDFILFVL
jgi:hypothetical protein